MTVYQENNVSHYSVVADSLLMMSEALIPITIRHASPQRGGVSFIKHLSTQI